MGDQQLVGEAVAAQAGARARAARPASPCWCAAARPRVGSVRGPARAGRRARPRSAGGVRYESSRGSSARSRGVGPLARAAFAARARGDGSGGVGLGLVAVGGIGLAGWFGLGARVFGAGRMGRGLRVALRRVVLRGGIGPSPRRWPARICDAIARTRNSPSPVPVAQVSVAPMLALVGRRFQIASRTWANAPMLPTTLHPERPPRAFIYLWTVRSSHARPPASNERRRCGCRRPTSRWNQHPIRAVKAGPLPESPWERRNLRAFGPSAPWRES